LGQEALTDLFPCLGEIKQGDEGVDKSKFALSEIKLKGKERC
jgi:hypothetical protein